MPFLLQGLHQELNSLTQNKQAGLEQLKQLMSQQQELNAQLNQAQHESDASSRQLERLQRENMMVHVVGVRHIVEAWPARGGWLLIICLDACHLDVSFTSTVVF